MTAAPDPDPLAAGAGTASEPALLVGAGLELLAAGYDPTVAAVCERSGVDLETFGRWYGSHADLVAAMADRVAERVLDRVEAAVRAQVSADRQLRAAVRALMEPTGDAEAAATLRLLVDHSTGTTRQPSEGHPLVVRLATLLEKPMSGLGSPDPSRDARTAALLLVASLEDHLRRRTSPGPRDLGPLVAFITRGVGT